MSQFATPNRGYVGMQPSQQAPASPPKGFGYVSGSAPSSDNLNGYVGGKPAVREEPGNPQAKRQAVNYASPDPTLSNQAFTQSQFTTNVSAAAMQSAAIRNMANNMNNNSESSPTNGGASDVPEDPIRASLRRYKEANNQSRGGGSCAITPHPSFTMQRQQQQQTTRPVNGRVQSSTTGQNNQSSMSSSQTPLNRQNISRSPQTPPVSPESPQPDQVAPATYVGYTLSDPGSMYKAFSGSNSWFRVIQMIVPEGKKPKRVYVASMLVGKKSTSTSDGADTTIGGGDTSIYSLRLVDTAQAARDGGRISPLWADYACNNTENFQVYTMDLSNSNGVGSKGGLLEIQAQNAAGLPVLFSSVILEF